MSDLHFCYLHMSANDLRVLDTIETPEYITGDIHEVAIDVPAHMIPPNPDDSDALPSQMHPSYPYGNPRLAAHPANRPRAPYDPGSRALFEDTGTGGAGIGAGLRWQELALGALLPIDTSKAEADRAAQARKMASGAGASASQHQPRPPPDPTAPQQGQQPPMGVGEAEGDDEGDSEDDDGEDDGEGDEDGEYDEDREGDTSVDAP